MYKKSSPNSIIILITFLILILHLEIIQSSSNSKQFRDFEKWFGKYSPISKFHKVKLNSSLYGTGVIASKSIKKDEVILEIPKASMISQELILEDPKIGQLLGSLIGSEGVTLHDIMAVFFLYYKFIAKSPHSWSPYFDLLPITFDNVFYFSKKELNLLQGSALRIKIEASKRIIETKYKIFDKKLFSKHPNLFKGKVTIDQFTWGMCVATSRKTKMKEEDSIIRSVIPFFDFFNYNSEAQATWNYDETTSTFKVISLTDIPKGNEIFISYFLDEEKCNFEFLEDYGFIEKNLKRDCVYVPPTVFKLSPNDPIYNLKKDLFINSLYDMKIFSSDISPGLKKALKVWYLTKEEAKISNLKELLEKGLSISKDNENQVFLWLTEYCEYTLKKYATSIQEDENLISSPEFQTLSNKSKFAIQFRIEEKQILQNAFNYFSNQIKLLENENTQISKDEL